MEMIDVKRTAADKEAEREKWESSPSSQDDYPYGLTLFFDNDTLKKLGLLDTDFDAGQPVNVTIEGFISEDSVRQVNGEVSRSMTVQTRKIAVSQEKESTDVQSALYGR